MRLICSTLLVTSLAMLCCVAQARLPDGQPPVRSFQPDLGAFPQNFSIAVDAQSRVYVGNTEGVLIFDGVYWQQVPVSNGDIVRSLAQGQDGRIYVGGYDAFGYIEQGPTGEFVYRELSDLFDDALAGEAFADIWHVLATADAIYFVGLKHLFRWDPRTGRTALVRHDGSFGPIAEFQDRVLLQFRGEGIKVYQNDAWVLLDGPDLARSFLPTMVVLDADTLILVAADDVWYRFDGVTFTPMPEADDLSFKGSVTHGIKASDGTIALATQLGKVVFYTPETDTEEVVDVSVGFIADAARTSTGQLLFVDDQGFHSVSWPAPWRVISDGLAGSVHSFHLMGDDAYVLTSSGAFVSRGGMDGFARLPWTDYEAWDMAPLATGGVLFADSYEIKHITAAGDVRVVDASTTGRLFHRAMDDDDVMYVGTEYGLQILQRIDGAWTSMQHFDDMDALRITQIIETAPGELWVGSERGGIRRLWLQRTPDWTLREEQLGAAQGLDYGDINAGAYLQRVDGELVASTSAGLFVWRGERFEPAELDGLAALVPRGQTVQIVASDSERWAFTWNTLLRRNGRWYEQPVASLAKGAFTTIRFVGDRAVVGNLGSLLVFDASAAPQITEQAPLELSSATVFTRAAGDEDESTSSALPLDRIRVSSGDSRLTLRFVLPDLSNPEDMRYRTRLLPAEASYSPWSADSQQSFVALSPGDYEFQVQARDSLGRIARLSVPIEVQPLWFEAPTTRAIAALLVLLVVYRGTLWSGRRRAMRVTRERDRLEVMVAERTEALRAANDQLDQLAHLDGLTKIPNRRRLDAYLEDVWTQSVDRSRPLAVALFDVDHFKRYNDTRGHQAGDALLVALAELLTQHLRRSEDLVARYGGEEFLVVMPGADTERAASIIDGMREAVASSALDVTISAGLQVVVPDGSETVADMIAAADAALYRAKNSGRNRIEVA